MMGLFQEAVDSLLRLGELLLSFVIVDVYTLLRCPNVIGLGERHVILQHLISLHTCYLNRIT